MEYEFQRDTLTGTLYADFSMGQEVLGFWFVEELGDSIDKYQAISSAIIKLQSHELKEWRMTGKALSIELDREEVRVSANELDDEQEFDLEESMSLYDGESEAFCGLEDFNLALKNWRTFIDDDR